MSERTHHAPVVALTDENEANRAAVARMLLAGGFEVREAGTGAEALQLAAQQPDIFILDVRLPDTSGFKLGRRLKSDPATRDIPVLLMTASFTSAEREAPGLGGGADGYLVQPVEPLELLATVRALLRARDAEAQVRAAARAWTATFDALTDAICLTSRDSVVLRCNRAFAELVGRSFPEILGRGIGELVPELAGPAARVDAPADGAPRVLELRIGDRWFDVRLNVAREGGPAAPLAWVITDRTEWKQAEEAVRQSQKLEGIGLLAGGIAHDFNNLLTGILGNASLARQALPPNSPAAAMLADVVRASERAAALTNQLLAYAGKGRFFVQPMDLARMIRDITGLIRTSLPKKVEIRREIAPDLPLVEADAGQLQQVVMNLVINAAEAIGDVAGTVTIRVRNDEVGAAELQRQFATFGLAPGAYVRLEVQDTGAGMDPATQARIFDPFFTTKFTGRGLGLAAVLGIVRGHKGGIAVETAPGQGTTFTVLLPALAGPEAPALQAIKPAARRRAGTVLVVDDEDIVRRAARATLEAHGYTVLEACNGVEAIDLVRLPGQAIRAVLLDMTMPVMSGDEAVRHLKRARPDLPVLATSGYGELEAIRRFTGTGVDGFLQKPYTADELVERLDAVLARRQS